MRQFQHCRKSLVDAFFSLGSHIVTENLFGSLLEEIKKNGFSFLTEG